MRFCGKAALLWLVLGAGACTRSYAVRPTEIIKLATAPGVAMQSSYALMDPSENVIVVEDPTEVVLTTNAGRELPIRLPFEARAAGEQAITVQDSNGPRTIWLGQIQKAEVRVFDEKKVLLYGFAGAIVAAAAIVIIR